MKNRIYFFSGTGNSLKLAKDIAERLDECEIIAITDQTEYVIPNGFERIGFVYPVYFLGIPKAVSEFISRLQMQEADHTFVFSIATYGLVAGNGVGQLAHILRKKGIHLNYGARLKMFSNNVAMYNMSVEVEKITKKSEEAGELIITNILKKKGNKSAIFNPILDKYYHMWISGIERKDINFSVNDSCVSCGICADVCGSSNIILENGKPRFLHKCNQCMACIQFCPQRAINYKRATQKRRRYTHPQISHKELKQFYK